MPQARHVERDLLRLESEAWRPGGIRGEATAALEHENAKLKRLLADAMLDNVGLKDLLAKKW